MTTKQFALLASKRMEHCLSLLTGSKDKDYTRNHDKLWNFKRAARISETTPEQALKGMWIKHIVSVFDIIDDIDQKRLPSLETMDDKFTDMINYTLLLEGLIKERMGVYDKPSND